MKKLVYLPLTFVVLILTVFACNESKKVNADKKANTETYKLQPDKSNLEWKGTWIGGKSDGKWHSGTVDFTSGAITQIGNSYTGTCIIDMNTIKNNDIKSEQKGEKLVEDLESKYFFKIAKFPTVKAKLNSIQDGEASVTVTVLGIPITQDVSIVMNVKRKKMTLSGAFVFDLKDAKIEELFANPLKFDKGGLTSKVQFNLHAELIKE